MATANLAKFVMTFAERGGTPMSESEWLTCTDIYKMLEYLRGKTSDRKLRLFAVACCHRPFYQVDDERHRRAIRLAERLADEEVDEAEWRGVYDPAYELWRETSAASLAAQRQAPRGTPEVEALLNAEMATAAGWAVLEDAWEAAYQATGVEWDQEHADEEEQQIALLRDIIGNPFHPVEVDRSWPTQDVLMLAGAIYDNRAFDRMPILEDALEEADCDNADILAHCRSQAAHARGCWVVDAILGKS
jgi:hypothetical protein